MTKAHHTACAVLLIRVQVDKTKLYWLGMILEYFKKARRQKHYEERKKLDTKGHVWHPPIYMKCAEEKQTHRQEADQWPPAAGGGDGE